MPVSSSAFESIELEEEIRLPPNLQAPIDFALEANADSFYVIDGKAAIIWRSNLENKEWSELARSDSRLAAIAVNGNGVLSYASKDALFIKGPSDPQAIADLAGIKALGWDSLGRIWALSDQLNIVDPEGGLQTSFGDFSANQLMAIHAPTNWIVIYDGKAKKLRFLDAKGSNLREIEIQKNTKLTAFCVDEFGWTYIGTDEGKILEFSPIGTLSGSFGRRGRGYGEFGNIQKLSCARLDEIWALDSKNKKIARLAVKNPDKKTPLTAKFEAFWNFIIRDQKPTSGYARKIVAPAQSQSLWLALADKKGALATKNLSDEIKKVESLKDETGQALKLESIDSIETTPDAAELYILEAKKSRVLRVNTAKAQVLATLGGKGSGLKAPRDILLQGGRLYVAEKDKIHIYTPKGIFLDTFGPAIPLEGGGDPLRFENLTRLRGRPETGWIYALDSFQSKIFVFDSNAKLISVVGESNDKDNPEDSGVIESAQDMTTDPYGNLYVLTAKTVEVFALKDKIFDFIFRWYLPPGRVKIAASFAWSNQSKTKSHLYLSDSEGKTLSSLEVRYTPALSPEMFALAASSEGVQINFIGLNDFNLNAITLYRSNSSLTSNMGSLKNIGNLSAPKTGVAVKTVSLNDKDFPADKALYFYWATAKSLWSGYETPHIRLNDAAVDEGKSPPAAEAPSPAPKTLKVLSEEKQPEAKAEELPKPKSEELAQPQLEEPKEEPKKEDPKTSALGAPEQKQETPSTDKTPQETKPEETKEPETTQTAQ